MKKFFALVMVVCMMCILAAAGCADDAAPSINIGVIVVPGVETTEENGEEAATLVVYVAPVVENRVEEKLFENIVKVAEETSVKEYFGEEVMKEVAAFLPVEILPESVTAVESMADLENVNVQIDEFFAMGEEGYEAEYGDLDVTFEFATQYEDETVLVAMIGILPENCKIDYEEEEELEEDMEIQWIPVETTVVEGKVQVKLTEDILTQISEREVVFALLRIEDAAAEQAE